MFEVFFRRGREESTSSLLRKHLEQCVVLKKGCIDIIISCDDGIDAVLSGCLVQPHSELFEKHQSTFPHTTTPVL